MYISTSGANASITGKSEKTLPAKVSLSAAHLRYFILLIFTGIPAMQVLIDLESS